MRFFLFIRNGEIILPLLSRVFPFLLAAWAVWACTRNFAYALNAILSFGLWLGFLA